MKTTFIWLTACLLLGTLAIAYFAQGYSPEEVTICHYTGSLTNPWVKIVTDSNAINGHFDNKGTSLAGHEQDALYEGDWSCPYVPYCGNEIVEGDEECEIYDPNSVPEGFICNDSCKLEEIPSGGGGGGGGCSVPAPPENFDVQSGVLNDNTLELSWDIVPNADYIIIRHSETDGDWTYAEVQTENDGEHSFGGLVNGMHYWMQIKAINQCGSGSWSESVDPLP